MLGENRPVGAWAEEAVESDVMEEALLRPPGPVCCCIIADSSAATRLILNDLFSVKLHTGEIQTARKNQPDSPCDNACRGVTSLAHVMSCIACSRPATD